MLKSVKVQKYVKEFRHESHQSEKIYGAGSANFRDQTQRRSRSAAEVGQGEALPEVILEAGNTSWWWVPGGP